MRLGAFRLRNPGYRLGLSRFVLAVVFPLAFLALLTPLGVRAQAPFLSFDFEDGSLNDFLLNFLFSNGPPPGCLDAADTDGLTTGTPNITDAIRIFNWLFLGGPEPPALSSSAGSYVAADCGADPTPDDGMDCASPPDACAN